MTRNADKTLLRKSKQNLRIFLSRKYLETKKKNKATKIVYYKQFKLSLGIINVCTIGEKNS